MVVAEAPKECAVNLDKDGMVNPVVILVVHRDDWIETKLKYPYILDPPKTLVYPIYQLRCGHNRVEWAKNRGDDYIDAITFEGMDNEREAADECKRQSNWSDRRYGPMV